MKLTTGFNLLLLAATATVLTLPVLAGEASLFKKDADAVEYRQATFTAIRHNFGQMRDMAGGKRSYSQTEFQRRADNLAALAKMPWEAFLPGTDMTKMSGHNEALPSIWTNNEEFQKLAANFEQNSEALAAVSKTGDRAKIKQALDKLGKESCKGCHKKFKD